MMARPVGWRDHLLGLALCVAYVAILIPTANDLAMSRDESFYVDAAQRYGQWFEDLLTGEHARTPERIDAGWSYNSEHPPLFKSLFAFSWLAQKHFHVFEHDSTSFRFPGMVSAGLLLWLIYIFGARAKSRTVGAFAALAYALLPRPFYHSHLDCFDVPITLMLTLVTYCYWRSLEKPWWALWTGVTYGLALATKHNSWLLPAVLFIHYVFFASAEWRSRKEGKPRMGVLAPWWLLAMVVMGPPIAVGLWPWLWHDTFGRVNNYVSFHMHHDYYNMEYFGRNYFRPPFPISYPFVMTLFTVPATTMLLALGGIGRQLRAIVPEILQKRVWPYGKIVADLRRTDILWLGAMMEPILVIALPSTPIFGGTKHWFPAYPFLALFAGVGFARLVSVLQEYWPTRAARVAVVVPYLCGALTLAPALIETAHSHPFALSHYGFFAGGVPGAADHGMNRQFWGFTTGSLVDFFKREMPQGGSVWICDTTWGAWQMLQRDGKLPNNIRASSSLANADFVLVHYERHFVEVDFQAWVAFNDATPYYVLKYDGVPIITVYENPRHRRARENAPSSRINSR
ncbi:MAG: glycosyltransferase family 39 protein [Sandaracinaceae bacterium]|nr:glycosyltransferase family 39 protein [Sandaracinaceae bacterium]